MSMKVTRVYTYWDPGDAHAVIEFLDILRDQLWETYGDLVIEDLVQQERNDHNEYQLPLPGMEEEI